jgi:hypothetical protein
MEQMNRKTDQWLPLLKQLKDAFDELKAPLRIELPSNGSKLIVEYVPRSGGIPSRESPAAVEVETSPSKTAIRRPHKCPECGQRFVQKAWLNKHIKRNHPKARKPAASEKVCQVCKQRIPTKGMGPHMAMHKRQKQAQAPKPAP